MEKSPCRSPENLQKIIILSAFESEYYVQKCSSKYHGLAGHGVTAFLPTFRRLLGACAETWDVL